MTTNDISKLLDQKLKGLTQEMVFIRQQMTTKDDLKSFATKDDLMELRSQMATKDDIKSLGKKIDKIAKDVKHTREILDNDITYHGKRLDRIEQKVGLPKLDSWQLA